jgi:hypothetical protein
MLQGQRHGGPCSGRVLRLRGRRQDLALGIRNVHNEDVIFFQDARHELA